MLTPKQEYTRLLYKKKMNKKVDLLTKKLFAAERALDKARKSCKHYHSFYTPRGNSGGWDRDDHYWYDVECEDCKSRWSTTSQDGDQLPRYAVKKERY